MLVCLPGCNQPTAKLTVGSEWMLVPASAQSATGLFDTSGPAGETHHLLMVPSGCRVRVLRIAPNDEVLVTILEGGYAGTAGRAQAKDLVPIR